MNSIVRLLVDEVLRRLLDDLLTEVAGAREHVDGAGVRDVLRASSCRRRPPTCRPTASAASNTVGTWIQPRSGFHEFQNRPCSLTSKPESIAACEGSVEARRIVRALQRVGAAPHELLVDGRGHGGERVGAQAVLAHDDDVLDGGAPELRRERRPARAGARRRGRRGVGAAAGGAAGRDAALWRHAPREARARHEEAERGGRTRSARASTHTSRRAARREPSRGTRRIAAAPRCALGPCVFSDLA